MGGQAGPGGDDRDVDVDDGGSAGQLADGLDEPGGRRIPPLGPIGAEERAEVPRRRGPQQGVRQGVQDDVAVGVAEGPEVARDLDPAQDTAPLRNQPVRVPAVSDPEVQALPRRPRNASAQTRSSG